MQYLSKRRWPRLIALAVLMLMFNGCQTLDPYTGQQKTGNTTKGGSIGALGGAVVGAVLTGGSREGILIGASLGALTGTLTGSYMDRQEAMLRTRLQDTGVNIVRSGDSIILNMPSNITFSTGSSDISADFYPALDSVALVINKFDKTSVEIMGYTDSFGAEDDNQALSTARASSVERYLNGQRVTAQRIMSLGMGEYAPVASNDTEEGRALNRRVEVRLIPITKPRG